MIRQVYLGVLIAAVIVGSVRAEPKAVATTDKVTVTLYDEPCAIPAVKNLPFRATWKEGGSTFEGCFTISGGLVMGYFDDRTVVGIDGRAFKKLEAL